MTVGENLYALRQKLGLTQKEFAEKVGVSQSAINYWENEKRQPRIEQLQKIATTLQICLDELLPTSLTQSYLSINPTLKESIHELAKTGLSVVEQNLENKKTDNLINNYNKLNTLGKLEAQKRVAELAELPKYQKQNDTNDNL